MRGASDAAGPRTSRIAVAVPLNDRGLVRRGSVNHRGSRPSGGRGGSGHRSRLVWRRRPRPMRLRDRVGPPRSRGHRLRSRPDFWRYRDHRRCPCHMRDSGRRRRWRHSETGQRNRYHPATRIIGRIPLRRSGSGRRRDGARSSQPPRRKQRICNCPAGDDEHATNEI
jgi:hypothetical protein